jgi:hypothetical protein
MLRRPLQWNSGCESAGAAPSPWPAEKLLTADRTTRNELGALAPTGARAQQPAARTNSNFLTTVEMVSSVKYKT